MILFGGAPGGIRTPDLKVRSLAFYPTKLRVRVIKILIYYSCFLLNNQVILEDI